MLKHFLLRQRPTHNTYLRLTPVLQSRSFWWSDDDDKKDKKPNGKFQDREPSRDGEIETNKPQQPQQRSPLHVIANKDFHDDNVIDVDSTDVLKDSSSTATSSTATSSSSSSSSSSTTTSDSDSDSDSTLPANLGEGENAPHIPSLMILPRRGTPVFPVPEVAQHLLIKNPQIVAQLEKQLVTGTPYIGVFLRKAEATVDPTEPESDSNTFEVDDVIQDLSEIHSVGTMAQVAAIRQLPQFNDVEGPEGSTQERTQEKTWHVMLTGHRRIRFDRTEQAKTILDKGPPMVINVEHLSTPNYDADDSILNATSQEIMNTMRDVLQSNEILHGPVQDFLRRRLEGADPPRLADFAASLTSAKPKELQNVMNTLDVQERLDLSLVLLKTEVERSNLRKQIRENVEKKISETQRKYMLQEQLKEIKNELGLQKDDKETLLTKFNARLNEEGIVVPKEAQQVIDEEM
jgi:Lon-like ATP-dependent protease